jgi:hypothetical protein
MLEAFLYALFSLVMFGLNSWIMELIAEFYAIEQLGLTEFQNVKTTVPVLHKYPWYAKFLILLTHPKISVIIRFYYLTHRKVPGIV